jgi:MarR family 2-MHQ and catechol resistance regulon transcriptional repressor
MDYKQEQSQLDLRLFRIWMKAFRTVSENIRKDVESHNISPENFMILELFTARVLIRFKKSVKHSLFLVEALPTL